MLRVVTARSHSSGGVANYLHCVNSAPRSRAPRSPFRVHIRLVRSLLVFVLAAVAPFVGAAQQVPAADSIPLVSITAGHYVTCGLNVEGRAFCWGANQFGQLGTSRSVDVCNGTEMSDTPCALHPIAVVTELAFLTIDAGARHDCGIATDSLAYCWGSSGLGPLGTMLPLERCAVTGRFDPAHDQCSHRPAPVYLPQDGTTRRFAAISAGDEVSCGLAWGDASVWC